MRLPRKSRAVLAASLAVAAAALPARGGERSRELYLGGRGGRAGGFRCGVDEDDLPRLRRVRYGDVQAEGSAVLGASFGEWHIDSASGFTWGFRADLDRFHPDAGSQAVQVLGSSDGAVVDTRVELPGSESSVTAVTGNVLASGRFGGGREASGSLRGAGPGSSSTASRAPATASTSGRRGARRGRAATS